MWKSHGDTILQKLQILGNALLSLVFEVPLRMTNIAFLTFNLLSNIITNTKKHN